MADVAPLNAAALRAEFTIEGLSDTVPTEHAAAVNEARAALSIIEAKVAQLKALSSNDPQRVVTPTEGELMPHMFAPDEPVSLAYELLGEERERKFAAHMEATRARSAAVLRTRIAETRTATAAQNEDAEREVETLAGLEALLESVTLPASDAA